MRYYDLDTNGWPGDSYSAMGVPADLKDLQHLPDQPSEWHRWDGTQWTEDTSPELMAALRARKAEEIKQHGLSLIQSQIPAIDSFAMVAFLKTLWPTLTDPELQTDLAYARDVYLYAVGKLDELETATREQIEGYDPATDTGWP